MNVQMKHNAISTIDLNIGKNIIDNNYGEISKIDKNAQNKYCIVKCTSDSYTLQSSHNIGKYFIKARDLVCYALY